MIRLPAQPHSRTAVSGFYELRSQRSDLADCCSVLISGNQSDSPSSVVRFFELLASLPTKLLRIARMFAHLNAENVRKNPFPNDLTLSFVVSVAISQVSVHQW